MKLMLDDILPLVGKDEASSFRLRFGEVVGIEGSTLVIAAKAGGTVYASTYVYCEVGDTVCYVADGANCVAFAAKDAARLEHELSQSVAYELPTMSPEAKGGARLGGGLTLEGDVLSVEELPASFIESL